MQPLPVITALKTARSTTTANCAFAATEPGASHEQTPVVPYADEQAFRQQQATAEQAATEPLTETERPDSDQPAAELSMLSPSLSVDELALLYRQPPMNAVGSLLVSPGHSSTEAVASVVAQLPAQSQPAVLASSLSAALIPVTVGSAQDVTQLQSVVPMLAAQPHSALPDQLSISSLQLLQPQTMPAAVGSASQSKPAEQLGQTTALPGALQQSTLQQSALPQSALQLSHMQQSRLQASTLQPNTLQPSTLQQSLALTSLHNRQLTALSGSATWLTSADSTTVNLLGAAATTSSPLAQWQSDPLPTDPARFGQRLLQLLQDKVDLQLGLGLNKALIRLDPPSLGSIELSVQLDGDKLSVQLHSSNAQLREAMGQGLEQLRANLQHKLGSELQIELQLSADGQLPQHATPAWLSQQISSNESEAEPAVPSQVAAIERRNYLNQLV